MKKRIFTLLMLFVAAIFAAKANPVDMRIARKVAVKFVNANTKTPLRGTEDLQLVTTYRTESDDAAFHIFNTPNGFVIVSADDCATPILGYSDEGRPFDMDNIPIQLQDYLQGFVEQIQYGIENHVQDETTSQQWLLVRTTGRLNQNRDGEAVEPLITANWGQGCYYNAMCPEDENGQCGHVPTGCVATAMGMIMHYWGYPAQGSGSNTYHPNGYPTQSVNYAATTYDWDNMPDQLSELSSQTEIDAVSTLLWHCGVSVDMMYGANSSSALDSSIPQAFSSYFGYCSGAYFLNKENYAEWLAQVKFSLDRNRPLLYFGTDIMGLGSHAFVCDGYDVDDNLHFNWGWGGNGNGYFSVDALNVDGFQFNNDVHALFGILPKSEFQLYYNIIDGGVEVTYEQPELPFPEYFVAPAPYDFDSDTIMTPTQTLPAYFSYPDTIVIPSQVTIDGITYPVVAIGDQAFQCCVNLKYVSMPNTITTIGDCAFYFDPQISHIDLPYGVTTMGNYSLFALSINSLDIPNSMTTIGRQAVSFTNLTSISIPRSVQSIGSGFCWYSSCDTVNWNADSCVILNPSLTLAPWGDAHVLNFGDNVKFIPYMGFWASNWETISIPDSVEIIEAFAFRACDSLTSVTIGKGVKSMGYCPFYGCENIRTIYYNCVRCQSADGLMAAGDNWEHPNLDATIVFGDDVRVIPPWLCGNDGICDVHFGNSIDSIGAGAFFGSTNPTRIKSLEFPESLKYIGVEAFEYCDSLTSITFPDSLNYIDDYCFQFCHNLTSIILGDNLEKIGWGAFSQCNIDTLTISRGVKSIGYEAFSENNNLTMVNFYADSCSVDVYTHQLYAGWPLYFANIFGGCSNLESANIGSNVKYIVDGLFRYCSSLMSVIIGDSVNYIGERAFEECYGLSSIEIPDLVEYIGDKAFAKCSNLDSIVAKRETPPSLGWAVFESVNQGIPIYVPCGSEEAYNEVSWGGFGDFIGNCQREVIVAANPPEGGSVSGSGSYDVGVTCTVTATPNEGYFFMNWSENGSVVSTEANYSFRVMNNRNLVANFGEDGVITFADESVKNICIERWDSDDDGELSYSEASHVTTLDNAFSWHNEIISFDEFQYFVNLTTISGNEFIYCTSLSSIVIPNSVISIGGGAFEGCSSLSSIEIPSSVISIGITFVYCHNLMEIIVDSGNAVYDSRDNCNAIIETATNTLVNGCMGTVIPNTVTSLGGRAFWACNGLTSIEIPNSVDNIGECAFLYCGSLANVIVQRETPPTLGWWAFEGVDHSIPVYVPCGFLSAYQNADGWNEFTHILEMCPGVITVAANPPEGGSVSGSGSYDGGATCTVTAAPNENFFFMNWTEDGAVVSSDSVYSFIVTNDRNLTANFWEDGIIDFVDENVKNICVERWDTNGDGELSYIEAASVTSLENAFSWNGEITSFDELQYFINLANINDYEFDWCYSLSSIVIPNKVTSIGWYAFEGCSSLSSIEIPSSVTSIGLAFTNCPNLEEIVVDLGNAVYDSRDNCNAIIATESNTLVVGCVGTVIPNTVTAIGGYAYYNCSGLSAIGIPNSVNYIGDNAFAYCGDLTYIIVQGETPPTLEWGVFEGVNKNIPVYVPCGSLSAYQNAEGWNEFTNILEMCQGVITVTANPPDGGTVSGGGSYDGGTTCTLTAMPNEGYFFMNWTENGSVVSTDTDYSFIVANDRNLVAHFAEIGSLCTIVFDLTDYCGDSWNGNYLVVDYGNGESEQLTVEVGSSASYTHYVLDESQITLTWIMGGWPEECFFTVSYEDGGLIYENGYMDPDFEYSFEVDCPGGNTVTQTISFSQGTNWFSTNLDISLDDLQAALVDALGTSVPITIKSKTQNVKYQDGSWAGSLTALSKTQMYKIIVSEACEIMLEGIPVDPTTLSLTITPGANWIAFPYNESMSVTDFFGSFPVNNDVVKSQLQNVRYNNGRWAGQLNTLMPGQGYMYNSAATEDRTFTFPTSK